MKTRPDSSDLLPGASRCALIEQDSLPGLTSACRNLLREAAALGLEFDDVLDALRASETDLTISN